MARSSSPSKHDERHDASGPRYLVAAAWSRTGGHGGGEATASSAGLGAPLKLVAHSATLLPSRPAGAAELLVIGLSRYVTLRAAEVGGGPAGKGGAFVAGAFVVPATRPA